MTVQLWYPQECLRATFRSTKGFEYHPLYSQPRVLHGAGTMLKIGLLMNMNGMTTMERVIFDHFFVP